MSTNTTEVGYVTSSRDFLIHLDGLPSVRPNDIIENESGLRAIVNGLEETQVEALILDSGRVNPGQMFKKSNSSLSLKIGRSLLGRAINPLGVAIDGHGIISDSGPDDKQMSLESQATGIASRQFIRNQFITGVSLVDTLVPIGKGQRELVIGDAHSGKTGFLVDLIVNQKNTDVICVYALIGKPILQVKNLIDVLEANNALDHTVVIAAASSDPAPLIFLAPKTALTVAEYFQRAGKDVLLILDDMGIHAKIYREISLLGDRSPGRESYPGDIFYQQAHLMERAGNFKKEFGGGSITALPVIELNLNDFTTFIPTNLMSMTDGHLMFKANLRSQGQTPAIDIALSVSRVGRQTQNRVQNLLSQRIRQVLAQAAELETVSRFSSELPYETQILLHQKELIEELIKQEPLTFVPLEVQMILMALPFTDLLRDKPVELLRKNKHALIEIFTQDPELNQLSKSLSNLTSDDQLITLLQKSSTKLQQLLKS
jgi:F-type H+/Na+-transporting ATPase subunit alpha